jgi:hypothetical protein
MTRMERQTLERELEQTRRLALEPTDPLTRERLAEMIEQLEFQLTTIDRDSSRTVAASCRSGPVRSRATAA